MQYINYAVSNCVSMLRGVSHLSMLIENALHLFIFHIDIILIQWVRLWYEYLTQTIIVHSRENVLRLPL